MARRAVTPVGSVALVALALLLASAMPLASAADAELVKHGEYLAVAGDCIACHSVPGGPAMGGGLSLPTPLGSIITTNITPSKTAGIGNYTLAQFIDAVRKGVRADGKYLYPAMPYTAYAKVSDDDMRALYSYFMEAVKPVDTAPEPTRLPFPFDVRLLMAGWNLLFLDAKPFKPDSSQSPEWNRGAYLALGLTHCTTCHTPRNPLMAEDSSRELGGGAVGAWYAPNITSDANSGIGGWSSQEIVEYLRHGANGKSQAAGSMAEAIDHSLRHLTDTDLYAIAVYLKTVPPLRDKDDVRPSYEWGAAFDDMNSIRGVALPQDLNRMTGPQLYDAYCATCHQVRGEGSFDASLPPLFKNTATGRANTNNLVMVMLEGIHRGADARDVRMPGFSKELSDQQIATLGLYLTQHYGNPSAIVSVEQVQTLRAGGTNSWLVVAARLGMVAAVVVLVVVVFMFRRRKRSK